MEKGEQQYELFSYLYRIYTYVVYLTTLFSVTKTRLYSVE
jgi:hypothetical protein